MSECLLCLTALFLLSWVLYLKVEVRTLAEKLEKLAQAVRLRLKDKLDDVEVVKTGTWWGTRTRKKTEEK